jgi:hypothetical protein
MPDLIPIGRWITVALPSGPGCGPIDFVGFTYVDPQAGFSAKGSARGDLSLGKLPSITLRLPMNKLPSSALSDEDVAQLGLPEKPTWVDEFYGPQPTPGTLWGAWRQHPRLVGRLHPEHPDDLQVLIHDGGPRLTDRSPEIAWASVTGVDEQDVFHAILLNQPHQLKTVHAGAQLRFIMPDGLDYGLMVTNKYLAERRAWTIAPCNKCGLPDLFDAPSDLIRVIFPSAPPDAEIQAFSSFCGKCGGVQMLTRAGINLSPNALSSAPTEHAHKRWWQLWKK